MTLRGFSVGLVAARCRSACHPPGRRTAAGRRDSQTTGSAVPAGQRFRFNILFIKFRVEFRIEREQLHRARLGSWMDGSSQRQAPRAARPAGAIRRSAINAAATGRRRDARYHAATAGAGQRAARARPMPVRDPTAADREGPQRHAVPAYSRPRDDRNVDGKGRPAHRTDTGRRPQPRVRVRSLLSWLHLRSVLFVLLRSVLQRPLRLLELPTATATDWATSPTIRSCSARSGIPTPRAPTIRIPMAAEDTAAAAAEAAADPHLPQVYHGAGSLRLKIKPRNAEVFIDGFYVGRIDSFDGVFQRLDVQAGPHKIELRAEGYQTEQFDVMVTTRRHCDLQGRHEAPVNSVRALPHRRNLGPLRHDRRGPFTLRAWLARIHLWRPSRKPAHLLRPERAVSALGGSWLLLAVAGSVAISRVSLGDGTVPEGSGLAGVPPRLFLSRVTFILSPLRRFRRSARPPHALCALGDTSFESLITDHSSRMPHRRISNRRIPDH